MKTPVPLYLFKGDGSFRKYEQKSALANELFKLLENKDLLKCAPSTDAWVIDFMAYCRKVSVKKSEIEDYNGFAKHF